MEQILLWHDMTRLFLDGVSGYTVLYCRVMWLEGESLGSIKLSESETYIFYYTCREMSLIWTSSVLHFPKSLISGDSALAGAVSHVSDTAGGHSSYSDLKRKR